MPELVHNYESRIKNFVFEVIITHKTQMAASKNPIKIKDYTNSIESSRKELLQEEDGKIKGRKGMVLKGFLTEKERIVIKKYL